MSSPKADELVALAEAHGWQHKSFSDIDGEGEHHTVQVSSDWGNVPDFLSRSGRPVWQWGIMVRWYRMPTGRWKLGVVNGHPVVGVAIGIDGVEREFWINSIRQLREYIVEPADLVDKFNSFWAVSAE